MKRTALILVLVLTAAVLMQTLSLAWMTDNGLSSLINITGSVAKNYFEYGEGSKDSPYGIATPVQLYYFSWLQYLGYFNQDENNDDVIDTYYFELANDLDMEGFKLPPIGTTANPFLGNFDGQGYTISNLTVKNDYGTLSAPPNDTDPFGGAEIIGFFGVVGSLPNPEYKYTTEANEVKNLAIKNFTIETQTENTLIGLVAGYVNGTVDCVGVLGGTITIKDNVKGSLTTYTKNLSDYSLVGYCTAEYKDSVYVMNLVISDPGVSDIYNVIPDMTSDGNSQGWGGSIAMDDMYTMLKTIRDSNNYSTNYSTFIYERVDAIINGKTVTLSKQSDNKRVYYDANFGSIVYSPRSGTTYIYNQNGLDYNYLSGSTRVTLYECKASGAVDGYYITDGTNYLTITGIAPNASITNTTSQSDAAIWRFSNGANGGTAYTVVGGYMYYLCLANSALTIYSVENSATKTSWSVSDRGIYSGTRYIDYEGNKWTLTTASTSNSVKKISNGNGVYLTVTNKAIGYTNIEKDAVAWTFEDADGTGIVYATVGNTTYYLRYDNGLTLATSQYQATDWTYNGSRLYYRSWSGTYYLRCTGTTWSASTSNSNSTVVLIDVNDGTRLVKAEERVDSYTYTSTLKLDNNESNRYFDADGKEVITPNLDNRGITCYPLTFEYNSNNRPEVVTGNTGYVIGSSYDTTTTATYPDRTGDIRVSKYPTSNLGSRTNPYCMNYATSSFTQVNSLNGKGLNKYSECYDDYIKTTQSSCYGIHFMNSVISKDSLVSVDNVTILGKSYDDYEMPTACIDFNLKEAGFINFFAGTYFSNNDTFFSLHKIERGKDENDPETYGKILSIKEIQYIYGVVRDGNIDFSVPYYYSYKDGTSDPIDSKYASEPYQVVFNTDWITNPKAYGTWNSSQAYYFEVPVYAGEYALGSVKGKTGAYLVYLDLAANAQVIERQKDYEQITEEKVAGELPQGVELLAPGETPADVDPKDSAFVSVNKKGEIIFSTVDGVTITHTAKDGTEAEYIGPNNKLVDGNGNEMTVNGETTVIETTVIERTTYRDHNLNTNEYTVTVITKTTAGSSVTYERTVTKGTWNTETNSPENMGAPVTTGPQAGELLPETEDSVPNEGGGSVGADLIRISFAYGQDETLTAEYVYDRSTLTYKITVTNGGAEDVKVKVMLTSAGAGGNVAFYINGTKLAATTKVQTIEVKGTAA